MAQFHFDPDGYLALVTGEMRGYWALQDAVASAAGEARVEAVLELGTGTGVTAARVLARQPGARYVGVDESPGMLDLEPGVDLPSPVADQVAWLDAAWFAPAVGWRERDLAVLVGTRRP